MEADGVLLTSRTRPGHYLWAGQRSDKDVGKGRFAVRRAAPVTEEDVFLVGQRSGRACVGNERTPARRNCHDLPHPATPCDDRGWRRAPRRGLLHSKVPLVKLYF